MSTIIGGMILLAIITGAVGGNMSAVSTAAMSGCGEAVQLVISLAGTICLWSGVMRIADRSGLTDALSRAFRPINRVLFRELDPDGAAVRAVSMNMAANLLGLGNAATPLGLAAMKELEKVNRRPGIASQAMVTFVVLNTASLQLLPTTNAYLRLAAGSKEPMEILPAVWLASTVSIVTGVIMTRLLRGREKGKPFDEQQSAKPPGGWMSTWFRRGRRPFDQQRPVMAPKALAETLRFRWGRRPFDQQQPVMALKALAETLRFRWGQKR